MNKNIKWILTIIIFTFITTILFSLGSQILLKDINVILGIIIIFLFIIVGVAFDIIGVAVQSSDTTPFHAMASKKIKSAKHAKKMIKNAAKVSTFCNDVIGDICNIISGSAGVIVSTQIASKYDFDLVITTLLITSLIASLTIGGKALGKIVAINKSEYILERTIKIMTFLKIK